MKNRVITISREFGSGGRTIGKRVAEKLDIPCYDAEIIQEMAKRLGLDWHYAGPHEVFAELTQAMPSHAGLSWDMLVSEGAVVAPKFSATEATTAISHTAASTVTSTVVCKKAPSASW